MDALCYMLVVAMFLWICQQESPHAARQSGAIVSIALGLDHAGFSAEFVVPASAGRGLVEMKLLHLAIGMAESIGAPAG